MKPSKDQRQAVMAFKGAVSTVSTTYDQLEEYLNEHGYDSTVGEPLEDCLVDLLTASKTLLESFNEKI
jgi:effector-binding domain-containing protein